MATATAKPTQSPNAWPMMLPATRHMRACFVMPRDAGGMRFAIRAVSGGGVCELSREEAFVFEQLRTSGVQSVLQSKFGSAAGIKGIEPAVELILHLHDEGLLEPLADLELMKSIQMLASRRSSTTVPGANAQNPSGLGEVVKMVIGHPATGVAVVTLTVLFFLNPVVPSVLSIDTATRQIAHPATALAALWFAVLTASTIYSLITSLMMQGSVPPVLRMPTSLTLRRHALFFLLAETSYASADIVPRKEEIRLRATFLILPWACAGCVALASGGTDPLLIALAFGFAMVGLRETTPVDRGQLVALLEAWSLDRNLLEKTANFLRSGLLRFDQKAGIGESFLATTIIAWLGALTIYGAELLVSSTYELGNRIAVITSGQVTPSEAANAFAAAVWFVMLGVVAISSILRLVAIPFQNAFSLAAVPLRALRPKALLALSNRLTPEALCNALRGMPIFADRQIPELMKVVLGSRVEQVGPGKLIIQQGEAGEEFYVILDGEFEVALGDESGQVSSTIKLVSGDSFGELALLEARQRAASVKSITTGVVLAIPQEVFSTVFPPDSPARQELTHVMRVVKLLQESEALSYLTPAQTMAVARAMQPRAAKAGETMIREGDTTASCAYLIESGSVSVTLNGHVLAGNVARGALIGTTALVNDSPRTATVTCNTDITCYELSRQDFLDACSSNAVVALVLGNMTQSQLRSQETVSRPLPDGTQARRAAT